MQTQKVTEEPFLRSSKLNASRNSSVRGVDHVTYAVAAGMLEKWAWYHIEVEGGHLLARYDDVTPDNPNSSMRLWCIGYESFWIALIEGIDRAKKSQVTVFVEKHGDHSIHMWLMMWATLVISSSMPLVMGFAFEAMWSKLEAHGSNSPKAIVGEIP